MHDLPPQPSEPIQSKNNTSKKWSFLNNLLAQHPILGTLLLFVYFAICQRTLSFALSPLVASWHMPFVTKEIIGECLSAILVIIPLLLLGWWSQTGFTRGIRVSQLPLYIAPFFTFAFLSLCTLLVLPNKGTASIVMLALLLALLVGLVEEGFFRGLLLQGLLPKGIWLSVLLSSFLFAIIHLSNIFVGFPFNYIAGQLLLTFGSGVLLAALRLRSGSIWPGILLHAARDFPGLILLTTDPSRTLTTPLNLALIVNGILCLLYLINAIVILRPNKVRELRMTYGLAPAPTLPPYSYNNTTPPAELE